MRNTHYNSNPSSNQSNTRDAVASLKVVAFVIGNLNFALRIETVYKVLNQTPVYGSGLNSVGIAHIGDREVIVVDLHRQLFQSSISNGASKGDYLIIAQSSRGELYGIPVAIVPALMEIPLSIVRVLPESYRHADTLGFASHVAVIPQVEAPLTIFLLDVEQLLAP